MSCDSTNTKKRRISTGNSGGDDDGSSTAAMMIAKMKEHMICMQNKIDGMQSEMNGMKSRLSRMDELEQKCSILEEKCDYFERGMKILIKENKWEYSAPSIPYRHWIDLGFGEDYIEDMESLLSTIKSRCSALRKGEGNIGDSTVHLESPSGTLLRYDDALLQHWKEFATALQLNRNNNIEFTIQNVQLTPSVIDLLIPVLKGKLIKLCLNGNEFTSIRQGIKLVVKCMEYNHQMREFYLSNNPLEGVENAQLVLDAIIGHPSITNISLENCLRGGGINGYDMLCSLLASGKSFEYIDLDNNDIETGLLDLEGNSISGNTAIPDYIASNPPLKKLFLSGNKLDDDDAIWIARALRQNTNLEHLYLHNNDFTDIGCQALSKATYDSTSLNSVFDCNHTCSISGIYGEDGIGIPLFCKNASTPAGVSKLKTTRGMKIEYILCARHREGSNVQYLNLEFDGDDEDGALTLKFVPKVLEAVYNYSNHCYNDALRINPLSIMYEILRGWKMPELYGNR